MFKDRETEVAFVLVEDLGSTERRIQGRRYRSSEDTIDPWSYWAKRGEGTIRLEPVEYRILRFLAARPNQALSRRRIAEAVSTAGLTVTVDMLGRYIHSLRGQLGFFSDYIQSVPYIGYRFKE